MNFLYTLACATLCALFFFPQAAQAQCPHDPTVYGDTILCPNSTGLLQTESADFYQWYRRDWGQANASAIPGATGRTLPVDAYNDAGAYFSVDATLNNCTERSPEVLLDGWVFLPPTVMHQGNFRIGQNGESLLCDGDTMTLHLMMPYDTLITWFKDGSPILGANIDSLIVTESGYYWVEGAPKICPNFVETLGVTIEVIRYYNIHPVLQLNTFGEIEITNAHLLSNIQWYRNDTLLSGETSATLSPTGPGIYRVTAIDTAGCPGESMPFLYNPAGLPGADIPGLHVYPVPATEAVYVHHGATAALEGRVVNATGAEVWNGMLPSGTSTITVAHLPAGIYYLVLGREGYVQHRQAFSVVR